MKGVGEQLGIPGLEMVNRNWIEDHEPSLSREIQGALLGPTAAVINPTKPSMPWQNKPQPTVSGFIAITKSPAFCLLAGSGACKRKKGFSLRAMW
jgi:hypothetical protein